MFRGRTLSKLKFCLAVATAILLTIPALAFDASDSKWTLNRTVVMHLSLGGPRQLQDGFTSFNASAADALNLWNPHLAHMKFAAVHESPMPKADGDADNSVFFSSTIYGDSFGSNVLAVTLLSSRGPILSETDVIFNTAKSWDSYRGAQQAGTFDFHRVALHEFGHVIGLDHPDQANQTVQAIMNSKINNIDSLQSDDIAGAHSLYGSGPAYLSSVPAPALVNLSTRAFVGTGANVLIGGFIVQGSQAATILLRGIGHSLAGRGLLGSMTDPVIELRNSAGTLIEESDDWIDGANAKTIASYRLDPANSRESAIIRTLNPGSYTVVLRSFDNADGDLTGIALVELYDLHTTGGRAGNISTRGRVGTGSNVMIAGFIIGGNQTKSVVVRALGPSLTSAGVPGALEDPVLELRDANANLVRDNDDWPNDPEADAIRSSGLAPTEGVEAAMHVTLNPGSYTAITRGFENRTGTALVEVYDLSPAP